MNYHDSWSTCQRCDKQFVFRIEDQRRQAERGEQITAPPRCPTCRQDRPRRQPALRAKPRPSPAHEPGPHEGSVKWFSSEKGYGFIIHPNRDEVFFHSSGVMPGEPLHFPDGTRVTYLIEETEKGPQAVDVARMDDSDQEEEASQVSSAGVE